MTAVEQFIDKPLPCNDDAERILLGSILINNRTYELVAAVLEPADMYSPINRRIFDAMVSIAQVSKTINPIQIMEYWKTQGLEPESLGGIALLTNLYTGLPPLSDQTLKGYVSTVKGHAVARRLIQTCNTAIHELMEGAVPVKQVLEKTEAKVLGLSTDINVEDKKIDQPFSDLIEIVPQMRQQFEDYHFNRTSGVPTGMDEVDEKLDGGGLQGGGVYLVAAGEKTGKTSLGLDWLYAISFVNKLGKSLVSTGEMSKLTMAKRIYCSHIGVPYYRFRPGLFDSTTDKTYSKVMRGIEGFGQIPIAISDKLFSMGQIKRHFRRQVEYGHKSNDPKKKVKVGMIDYIQLMSLDNGSRVSRTEEVEKVSREIKLLASELEIPIIAISSLNRLGLESNQIPDTFNLRQAGTLGYDAEAIFFLHNPAYVPGQPYTPSDITPMNLILSRQRNGPSGVIPLMFIGPYMQFMTVKQFETSRGANNTDALPKTQGEMQQAKEANDNLWA